MSIKADGSAMADAHNSVEIDREAEPYRWRCPNGHTDWDRTNNHVWCRSCRRQLEGQSWDTWGKIESPEHWEIVDEKTGETIPWDAIRYASEEGD